MNHYRKICRKCGKEFFGSRNQRFCGPECKEIPACKIKKNDGLVSKPKQIRKKKVATIDEIARKAKSLGMSYGKYIQMLAIEKARKEREERMNLV